MKRTEITCIKDSKTGKLMTKKAFKSWWKQPVTFEDMHENKRSKT